MNYTFLGKTGVQVSELCFGTMTFGNQADEAESKRLFSAACDAGINFFDSANVYGRGIAETILGKCIQGRRNELVITTKVYNKMSDQINDRGSSRRHITAAIEASLKRLHTDYVDIYFLHGWDEHTALEETLSTLTTLMEKGKIIYYGISNFSAWQIEKAIRVAERNNLRPPSVIQPMYNLVKRQAEVEILPMALDENLGVISYSPLGGGLLTGKYLNSADTSRGRLDENDKYKRRFGLPRYRDAAEKFIEYAEKTRTSPISLAVAWVLAHPAVTAPIIGARSVEQLRPSLDAVKIDMTPELYEKLSSFSEAPPPATDRNE
ncbi:MAG: aldo/keto reductase [Spirochaetales bacterium]|nr:aldo/keto reductase [Spirochaetales bacterium]